MEFTHLTKVNIKNFKRFKSLKVDNIGQFNLILGDNNVGKTSFLESLLLNNDLEKLKNYLLTALSFKRIAWNTKFRNFDLRFYLRNIDQESSSITFDRIYSNGTEESFILNIGKNVELEDNFTGKELQALSGHEEYFGMTSQLIPFIPFFKGHDGDLVNLYSQYIQNDKKRKESLLNVLRVIDLAIDNLEISLSTISQEPVLVVSRKNDNSLIPLAFYGDGVLKLLRYFIQIIIFKNSTLMIDEVDTGIHYSRMNEFWTTLLKSAKENNVQLFMTTHNKECITYFINAVASLNLETDARAITLVESSQTFDIKSFTYSFDQMEHSLEFDNEIRGGY